MSKVLIPTSLIKEYWRLENEPSGRAFGFPKCCIDEFCEDPPELYKFKDRKTRQMDRIRFEAAHVNGKFSGFIPCQKHAIQIINGEIKLQDLIKDRRQDLKPFPDEWG